MKKQEEKRNHYVSVACALFGTFLEYFDHFIYTYFFLIFLPIFFPSDDPYQAALVRALAISVGFIVRPFGSFGFALMADMWGRRKVLIITSLITGFATLGIGLLPSHEQIGSAASFSFITLRILQMLAISGETTTATYYLYEYAARGKKATYTSLTNVVTTIGSLFAAVVCAYSLQYSPEYNWRLPFVIAGTLSLAGYLIRHKLKETPTFEHIKKEPIKLWQTVLKNPENVAPHLFAGVLILSVAYVFLIYLSESYKVLGFTNIDIIYRSSSIFALAGVMVLIWSFIGDRWGNKNVSRIGAFLIAIGAMPCLYLLDANLTAPRLLFVHLYFASCWAMLAATTVPVLAAIWPPRVALQIGALIWGIGGLLSAGGMPLLMLCTYEISSSSFLGVFLTCVAFIMLVSWHRLPDNTKVSSNNNYQEPLKTNAYSST